MRVSTAWAHQSTVSAMLNQQAKMQQTQLQLSTGKKILTPSDDPASSALLIDLSQSLKQQEQYQNNINTTRHRLTMEEGVLESATDILQRIHELGVQGVSDTNTPQSRIAAATEMEALNEQLLNLANTKNANGEYMFSGFKSDTQPFSKDASNPGAYAYAGDTNVRSVQIDVSRQITDGDTGSRVFGIPTGPSPATVSAPGSINNVFEAINKFAADLKSNSPSSASIGDISRALDNIGLTRASVGARLNALDKQDEINSDSIINTKSVMSAMQDLDYAEAISRFSQQQLTLQAAQQTFSQTAKLSLFNYL